MKKSNAHFKLQKNLAIYVKPTKVDDIWNVEICPMDPHNYDVVPDPGNKRVPMAVVISDYTPQRDLLYALDAATANRTSTPNVRSIDPDNVQIPDSHIAQTGHPSSEEDKRKKRYIWWSKNYHFTTNGVGDIVPASTDEEGYSSVENHIKKIPMVFLSEDQDDSFWSDGGDDLCDAAIKINTMLTNINHIAVTQGFGQPIFTGKNAPKSLKLGPNHCLILEYTKEDPEPKFDFLTSQPPIEQLIGTIELYIALLLSTNNLSVSSVKSQLSGGTEFPSGIAMVLDKAESMEDVEEQAEVFRKNEPKIWSLFFLWAEWLKGVGLQRADELQKMSFSVDTKVTVTFPPAQVIMSEKEKLDVIKMRKELGINTMVELIMRDNPSLTEKQAEDKLKEILEEAMERQAQAIIDNGDGTNQPVVTDNEIDEDGSKPPTAGGGEKPEESDAQDKDFG